MTLTHSHRRGFTLIEVLVAAGLCMLIMYMVTVAFQRGMDTLSQLKSVGELQQRLRNFERIVRGDLESDHFESRYGPKLSDQRADKLFGANNHENLEWRPPTRGFFRLVNDVGGTDLSSGAVVPTGADVRDNWGWMEGTDSDGIPSSRAITHMMHFTIRRDGSRADQLFSSIMPGNLNLATGPMKDMNLGQLAVTPNTLTTDWAEVVYFLDLTNGVGATPDGTPLYGLHRRLRLVPGSGNPGSVDTMTLRTGAPANQINRCQAISTQPVYGTSALMNGPTELRDPRNRLGGLRSDRRPGVNIPRAADCIAAEANMNANGQWLDANNAPTTTVPQPTGNDLLLTDVISFEVKADWDINAAARTSPVTPNRQTPSSMLDGRSQMLYDYPFNVVPQVLRSRNSALADRRIFDTWFDIPASNDWLPDGGVANENRLPNPIRIRALQIKVRVWDRKNNMARQVTIIQNM